MDASHRMKENAEKSIIQHFEDVSAKEEDALFDELEDLKSRTGRSGSAWNLDELLVVMERLILSDREELERMKADLVVLI